MVCPPTDSLSLFFYSTKTSLDSVELELTYTSALLFFPTGNISNRPWRLLKAVLFILQSCISKDWAAAQVSTHNQCAPRWQQRQYNLKPLHHRWNCLILNPLQNGLRVLCFSCSYSRSGRWNWIRSASRWGPPLSWHYGFPMLIKISVCFLSHLTRWEETSDRAILEQPSLKRQRDLRLKSRAALSKFVAHVFRAKKSVCVHQWVHKHRLVVF